VFFEYACLQKEKADSLVIKSGIRFAMLQYLHHASYTVMETHPTEAYDGKIGKSKEGGNDLSAD
jgi:hypothetical protein